MNRTCARLAIVLIGALASLLVGVAESRCQPFSGGRMYVRSDPGEWVRELADTAGLCQVYIVHEGFGSGGPSFTGSSFRVEPRGFKGVFLADQSSYQTLGNSQIGIGIVYGSCLTEPGLILTISYLCSGTSACTAITLVGDPNRPTGRIEVYDCQSALLSPPPVGELCVNGHFVQDDFIGTCECTVPTESVTWGKIKALYE